MGSIKLKANEHGHMLCCPFCDSVDGQRSEGVVVERDATIQVGYRCEVCKLSWRLVISGSSVSWRMTEEDEVQKLDAMMDREWAALAKGEPYQ